MVNNSCWKIQSLRFSACFQKQKTILVGKLFCLFIRNVSLCVQVSFIAYQVDDRIRVCQTTRVSQPATQVIVCAAAGDIVHHQSTSCTAVITSCHCPETLLPGRIPFKWTNLIIKKEFDFKRKIWKWWFLPNLKLNFLARHFNNSCTKLNSNRVRTIGHNYK